MVATRFRLFSLFLVFSGFCVDILAQSSYNRVSPPQTYRGPTGRVIGRAYDNGGGSTSYYGPTGRRLGSSTANGGLYGPTGRRLGSIPPGSKSPNLPFGVKQ